MGYIDNETVRRILDTANIVDVVSDFVSLKRSGSGYKGLCPFHNERTPSFSVSPSRNVCKCFSCGKGGSPVNFIMELEQMSYGEALRYLARKYNIEIEERELTDEQRQQASLRESMFAVNEFANKHFRHNLTETADGRDIGLAYFRHRGISDAMIERFGLGYAIDKYDDLLNAATAAGYDQKYLIDTGLCSKNDRGKIYDRFRGRVTYPVHTVSGKVVAFGARTLRTEKTVAKYVNSPESEIYHKSRELYGLYQAKRAIVSQDKCILVEGYMDVISMHQAGVENVVASSGTSLTEDQIRLIHRFTDNVTVIYDSDAAGIKASLRGIDMLLAERLNIKVLLLPDGDDPDSFARARTHDEVMQYIRENETDFIHFKTRILLDGTGGDTLARSRVIGDIVQSVSLVYNEITRALYIQQCAEMFNISETLLASQVQQAIIRRGTAGKSGATSGSSAAHTTFGGVATTGRGSDATQSSGDSDTVQSSGVSHAPTVHGATHERTKAGYMREVELSLMQMILRFGMTPLSSLAQDGVAAPTVLQVICQGLEDLNVQFANDDLRKTLDAVIEYVGAHWDEDFAKHLHDNEATRQKEMSDGQDEISRTADSLSEIKRLTVALEARVTEAYNTRLDDFRDNYVARAMVNHPDDVIRTIANELIPQRYQLSKVHSRYSRVETERDMLDDRAPKAVFLYEYELLMYRISQLKERIRTIKDPDELNTVMADLARHNRLKMEYAAYLGERVITGHR